MHIRMLRAFLAARPARHRARFQGDPDDALVRTRPAAPDLARGLADIHTIKIKTNALGQIGDLIFAKTGIRAGNARLRAVKARFNTPDQGVVRRSFDARMRSNHLVNVHQKSSQSIANNKQGAWPIVPAEGFVRAGKGRHVRLVPP
jgi:hypothetical protein